MPVGRDSTDPKHILHLIDTGGPGGAETILYSLIRALPPEAWKSRCVVPKVDWLFRKLQRAGEDVVLIPSRGRADVRHLAGLVREVRRFRPRLIHAHLFTSGVYGSLAARIAGGTPLVLTFHGSPDVNPADRLLRLKARILSRSRNRVVYVSEDLRTRLEALLQLPEEHSRVIYNGIEFWDRAAASSLRDELALPVEVRVVGAVGNLRTPKDYPNLLRAAQIARRLRPDLGFVVLGGGPAEIERPLVDLRRELGLEGFVHFLGFREDVANLMSGFDLFVSSSSSEGLPLATLEAMGMGLPVVLTACGGPSEIVDSGRTGLLVPPRDPKALAAGIVELASDPAQACLLGEAGKTEVRNRFSKRAMVERYLELYEELLDAEHWRSG